MRPSVYPEEPQQRDRWITQLRGPREQLRADTPVAFHVEQERFASGEIGDVATIFLTNRECPWRCAMCDLWRHTLPHSVTPGDIPRQIEFALEHLPPARQIKLYNSGSFFDLAAIPRQDYSAIAHLLRSFERVIVESHPSLIREAAFDFQDLISGELEVAIGLETANPFVLEKLNKRMTLSQYAEAAQTLANRGISLRSFVLVQPPFMPAAESVAWACRSIDFASSCGATAISLIPTRGGNGAMEALARNGDFAPPHLSQLEEALQYGLGRSAARLFVDLWDLEAVPCCSVCRPTRIHRLAQMNFAQAVLPEIVCEHCEGSR